MKSIVEEKLVSFQDPLEQKVFAYVCELGRMITQIILENYDDELAKERDKKAYRDKGKRETSIKPCMGKVEYSRRVYRTESEDGESGLYLSAGSGDADGKDRADLHKPCRKDSPDSNRSSLSCQRRCHQRYLRQTISHGGVWNLIQQLGERISEEEEYAVQQMEADQTEGKEPSGFFLRRWMVYG